MRASSGEIHTIIETIATTVSSEVSSWLRVCCRLWATLSMSLVTRLSSSPRGWPSKYGSGSRCSLSSTSRAQPEDRAVDRAGEQPALEQLERGGDEVEREDDEEDAAEGGEVDALAGHDVVHGGEDVGDLVLAPGPQRVGGLLLGDPGRDLAAEEARRRRCRSRCRGSWGRWR